MAAYQDIVSYIILTLISFWPPETRIPQKDKQKKGNDKELQEEKLHHQYRFIVT